ncbi:MAG TPA: peptide chain release factor 1 [Dehalococcoidia bacterium]|nr:peptide chain release factor 1 [Dehalococcoidia bacterium]
MQDKLRALEERFEAITEEMGRTEVINDYQRLQALAKERSTLENVVTLYRALRNVEEQIEEARSLANESDDDDLARLARDELSSLEPERERLENDLRLALLPADPHDERDVIVEVRAGTGGEEASLFASELFRMYSRYAENKRWQVEVVSANESEKGGLKEIVFEIHGKGAYSRLKYESGGHRVQRVPATEAQGRIHTSTATVAVLPEAEEVEVDIDEKDLRIDIYHSGGAGGQNVNKVSTAVRMTHIPTGIVVQCQDERSQLKNRVKALSILRSRILQAEKEKQAAEISASRSAQVGTGERAEKIRTYNFPQDRVTDHRVDYTRHNLPRFMDGQIDDVIDAVATAEQAQRLDAFDDPTSVAR